MIPHRRARCVWSNPLLEPDASSAAHELGIEVEHRSVVAMTVDECTPRETRWPVAVQCCQELGQGHRLAGQASGVGITVE